MSAVPRRAGARPRRFSKREYYRLGELGFFRGQRVELIRGRIMVQSPQSAEHANALDQVADVLHALFGPARWVRRQYPLDLGQTTEPEPDVSVAPGPRSQYLHAHPTTALLVVEVSGSTLDYDRGPKASLYAAGGIADYWIVNLAAGQVEVYRDPVADAGETFGHRYATRIDLKPPAAVAPLALPLANIPVVSLIP